jgi:hypothetical protein
MLPYYLADINLNKARNKHQSLKRNLPHESKFNKMLIIMILSRKEFCRSLPQMRGLCSGLI